MTTPTTTHLTLDEAATQTGISARTLRGMITAGDLPARRVPSRNGVGQWKIRETDLPAAVRGRVPEGWASVAQAAELTGWGLQVIHRWVKAGKVQSTRAKEGRVTKTIVKLDDLPLRPDPVALGEEFGFFRSFGFSPEQCAERLARVYGLTARHILKEYAGDPA